jgi:glycosyltransferase involved in cell wall biosynthesis
LPAFGEGFGLAALEAMAAGLPTIATRTGPLPEVVVDGETGLLVAPGAVDELAGAIRRLACDTALRRFLGARGRVRAETTFSLPAMVDRTIQVYNEITSRSDPRRT